MSNSAVSQGRVEINVDGSGETKEPNDPGSGCWLIPLKVLITKITTKIVLYTKIFKKEGGMIRRILDNDKDTGCLSGTVWK